MNAGSVYLRKVPELFKLNAEKRKLRIKRKETISSCLISLMFRETGFCLCQRRS